MQLSRAVRLVLVIWLLALGLAVPQALKLGLVYEELPNGQVLANHSVCAIKRVVIPHSFEVSSIVFFVAPMTVITVLYALIGLQLRRAHCSLRCGGRAQIKATKHVIKMLGECQTGRLGVMRCLCVSITGLVSDKHVYNRMAEGITKAQAFWDVKLCL